MFRHIKAVVLATSILGFAALQVHSQQISGGSGGGGGGTPGGSNTQLQYNNSGAFGGTSGVTWAGTTLTAGNLSIDTSSFGDFTVTANTTAYLGGINASGMRVVGATNFGANFGATGGVSWGGGVNSGFRDIGLFRTGTASVNTGRLAVVNIDTLTSPAGFQVYNTTDSPTAPTNYERAVFDWTTNANTLTIATQKGGTGTQRSITIDPGNFGSVNIVNTADLNVSGLLTSAASSTQGFRVNAGNVNVGAGSYYGSTSAAPGAAGPDTSMGRVTGGLYEFGTGGASPAGTAGYIRLNGVTVASLPACSSTYKGARGTVTDATATTFMTTVVGSGSNVVPVFCDGTNWKIA